MAIYALDGVLPVLPESGNFWIADNAAVIGKVVLGENASVWFSAVLRGDNEMISVGENSNIQDGCVLHTDMGFPLIVEANVTVGHQAMLHGCTIGEGSLIGMGATIMNGAVIGKNCVVGARALVGEGKVIENGSLVVGMPGRAVRKLSDEDIENLKRAPDVYVKNHQRFMTGLERKD